MWTRPSRRDLARFRALNYMCTEWNSVHFQGGGVEPVRAYTCASSARLRSALSLAPHFFFLLSLSCSLSFIRIMNKYICRILTRVHGAWYARSVDQTQPESGRSVFSISPRMHLCGTCHENAHSVRLILTPLHRIFQKHP